MTTDPPIAADRHDLELPGGEHGEFRRLPFGMEYVVHVNPETENAKAVTVTVTFGYDSTVHKWVTEIGYNTPDTSNDIFQTADEIAARMWFGHMCYQLEVAAWHNHHPQHLPHGTPFLFGKQPTTTADPGPRTGQYL